MWQNTSTKQARIHAWRCCWRRGWDSNPRGPERPQAVRHHVGVSRLAPYLARRPRQGGLYSNFPRFSDRSERGANPLLSLKHSLKLCGKRTSSKNNSGTVSFSYFVFLNMWYFFRHDTQDISASKPSGHGSRSRQQVFGSVAPALLMLPSLHL